MIATGQVVESGQLENEGGALGFVIQRPNGEFITVKGLTIDETRGAARMLYQSMEIILQCCDAVPSVGTPP